MSSTLTTIPVTDSTTAASSSNLALAKQRVEEQKRIDPYARQTRLQQVETDLRRAFEGLGSPGQTTQQCNRHRASVVRASTLLD